MKVNDIIKSKSFKLGITVLMVLFALFLIEYRRKQRSINQVQLSRLPKFNAMDVRGRSVSSKNLRGKNVYIQFVNPFFEPDINLFDKVYKKWNSSELKIVMITNNPSQLNYKKKYNLKNFTLIEKDFDILCRKFKVNQEDRLYFIIDEKGNIVNSDRNYIGFEKGPKIFLKELIDGDSFSMSDLIQENKYIHEYKWFSQINKIIKKEKERKYYIISLFTKICDSCSGGRVIRALNKIEKKNERSNFILSILNNGRFREQDIVALKSQLNIKFDVTIADCELDKKWDSLINRYREDFLNEVVFLVNNSGKILKVADKSCNCYSAFFQFVNSL